ncbi:peptidase S8/S53 domain-containing protein [Chytridium lagenaria]|nr:peptidase S8/S53 domain-containing protein [Chytridium lagenaria]
MHPLLPILLLTTFTLPATPHLIPNEYIIIYKPQSPSPQQRPTNPGSKPMRPTYPEVAGAGSIVYVLDTQNSGFGMIVNDGLSLLIFLVERVQRSSFIRKTFVTGETEVDYNGHGTHISGIIAGRTYGVSKKSTIISVKVLNARGLGSTSGIVSALQWVKRHALASNRPCVVNVSVGGGASMAVDNAVNDVSGGAGCFVVAAAGNEGSDACQGSPGRARFAYTVGATDERDGMAGFRIMGVVWIFLQLGWAASNTAITTLSGTSMACPFVSGVAALAYSHFAFKSPGEAMTYINSLAATGQITGLTGERAMTPNRISCKCEDNVNVDAVTVDIDNGFHGGFTGAVDGDAFSRY